MKNNYILLFMGIALSLLTGCISTKTTEKATYINNDKIFISGEKITGMNLFAISSAADKPMYEKLTGKLQSLLMNRNVSSNMYFLSSTESPEVISNRMKEGDLPFRMVIKPISDSYQADEMNNPFIVKQLHMELFKLTGEKVALISFGIERNESVDKTAETIAKLLFNYLSKKSLI